MLLENLSSLFESLLDDSSEINAWVRFKQKVPSLGKLRKLAGEFFILTFLFLSVYHMYESLISRAMSSLNGDASFNL